MNPTILSYLSLFLISLPAMGLLLNFLSDGNLKKGAQRASLTIGLGLIISFLLLTHFYGANEAVYFAGFKIDALSCLMSSLIFFVSFVVHQFSIRYISGDRDYKIYFYKLSFITSTCAIMVLSDSIILFFIAGVWSNLLLISLMIHKKKWEAAAYSGKLAFQTLLTGAILFSLAIFLLYSQTGSLSISEITQKGSDSSLILVALFFCIVAAMTQSAIWPFHKWLISSLNSPTPVSALMHAGLVNGGGFLLVRFAPLIAEHQSVLNFIFVMGAISAILGTLWKLVQSDVKRMLACSTMGQMGFMMMQCGLGLFPAAIAHLLWHGLFKAYLFFSAGSAVDNKKVDLKTNNKSLSTFMLSCVYGFLGTSSFAYFSNQDFFSLNTTTFLFGFAFIAATQVAYVILQKKRSLLQNLLAMSGSIISGSIYGFSIYLIEAGIPSVVVPPHAITVLHIAVFLVFMMLWLLFNLHSLRFLQKTRFWKSAYMSTLNGSQPHPKTITSIRQSYHY